MTYSKQSIVILLIAMTFGISLLLSSCAARVVPSKDKVIIEKGSLGDKPPTGVTEVLEDFHIRVPESIKADEAFEIRITTIGSEGTLPFFEDGDVLELSFESSVGRLEPAKASLQGGIGSTSLKLSDVQSTSKTTELTIILKDLNQNLITKNITLNIQ